MSDKVTLTIDDQKITVESGLKVVDAAKAAGIDISVFCYHPKLEAVGACRMCLVEIGRPQRDRSTGKLILEADGSPQIYYSGNLETACTVPVGEGMVVHTRSENVLKARQDILEFILTSHPLDCPICDKGGECSLQDLTFNHGLADSRFPLAEKIKLGKHIPLGDLIYLDQERCIQCGRCIRFQNEIADDSVLAFYNRGRKANIVSYSTPPFDSYWSGNTTDLCPVGALTTKDFRFEARIWEVEKTPSICSHCPVGCNITLDTRQDPKTGQKTIQRVMPRQNEWVNEFWICDKGRFGHHFTGSDQRLTKPLARNAKGKLRSVSWSKALKIVGERFQEHTDGWVTLVGGRLSNEDLYQLKRLTDGLAGKGILNSSLAGGDLTSKVGPGKGTNLKDLGPGTTILVMACDLEEEAPLWWLRVKAASERGATLIIANPRETKLDRYADYSIRYAYGKETNTVLDLISKTSDAAKAIKGAENALVFFGAEGLDLKSSQSLSQACANLLIHTKHVGKKNSGLIAVWPKVNTQGAWDMGFRPDENLADSLKEAKNLLIAGADPIGDGIIDDLGGRFLLVQELFLTETAAQADLVLPVLAPTEKSGTYTSGDRRVQRFERALNSRGECQADYEIAEALGVLLNLQIQGGSSENIFKEIEQYIPDYASISLKTLRETPEQKPIVDPKELAYSGTVYKNTAGIGFQLSPAALEQEIKSKKVTRPRRKSEKGLVAVPITRLYDQGIMIRTSETLSPRLEEAHLIIHPTEAEKGGLSDTDRVELKIGKRKYQTALHQDPTVPKGVVLIPRSLGIPLDGQTGVQLKAAK